MDLRIGTAPDSWGVWFPADPRQTPWQRFLDEVVEAGYEWIELGPYGYLPTEPKVLRSELERRGIRLSGGTLIGSLHDPAVHGELREQLLRTSGLTAALGGQYLVVIDEFYRDPNTGAELSPPRLERGEWQRLVETANEFGRLARERFGLQVVFHSHADSHVETPEQLDDFLAQTDPELVAVCMDTGHYEYRGGDTVEFMRRYGDRTPYLHLKSVDPAVRARVLKGDVPFGPAVAMGVFCEPELGTVDFTKLARLLEEIDYRGWGIVEQDMFPCEFDKPLPIAKRTREYLRRIGLG